MGELSIRRERLSTERYEKVTRAEKRAEAGTVKNETVRQSVDSSGVNRQAHKTNEAASHIRLARQLLQTGSGAMAEVRDSLSRMAALARMAAGEGSTEELRSQLDTLAREVSRMLKSASCGDNALFDLEGEAGSLGRQVHAVLAEAAGTEDGAATLPAWLMDGMAHTVSREELLSSLGLDQSASPAELMAAIRKAGLGSDPAVDRLAALYLGAAVSGASGADLGDAMEGLRQLLEKTARGVPLDEAINQLTEGKFESLLDFEAQFTGGSAPDLMDLLTTLLLTDTGNASLPIMDALGMPGGGAELPELLLNTLAPDASLAPAKNAIQPDATPEQAALPSQAFGGIRAEGRDLSGVSYDAESGTLRVEGTAEPVLRGSLGQAVQGGAPDIPAILLTGSVTLRDVTASVLVVQSERASIVSDGQNLLGQVRMENNASLTLGGNGSLEIGSFLGNRTNTVTLAGGAVRVEDGRLGEGVTVLQETAAVLAAQPEVIRTPQGAPAKPFDQLWKALIPDWTGVTSLAVDGKELTNMLRQYGARPDAARVWLETGVDPNHGHPVHPVVITGRDRDGEEKVRCAWVQWDEQAGKFRELTMYPNPFTVTGGEEGKDWEYDQGTQTLRILTNQVTALAGGSGVDAGQEPFSGRVALADRLEPLELTLNGVACRVPSGRAFDLGRENDVTLLLGGGTVNSFASGRGCAGVSLGDGTSLTIDRAPEPEPVEPIEEEIQPEEEPDWDAVLDDILNGDPFAGGLDAILDGGFYDDFEEPPPPIPEDLPPPSLPMGALRAMGGYGGAGIGRDSGESRDRASRITIRGGAVTAAGSGGGAGIGAGRHAFMGPVSITGGRVSARGGTGGGAGIGAALGAPAGDITIEGGIIIASAACQAAAIGSGVEGDCGDILIAGHARIVKAEGGSPDAGIGACPFGRCGEIRIGEGADIGVSSVKRREREQQEESFSLPVGENIVRLPRFCLTPRMLRVEGLDVSSWIKAQSAIQAVDQAEWETAMVQGAYNRLYDLIVEGDPGRPLRNAGAAGDILTSARDAILQRPARTMRTHSGQDSDEVMHLLSQPE